MLDTLQHNDIQSETLIPAAVPDDLDTTEGKLQILLAEDVQADAMLTKISLESTNIPFSMYRVRKGNELVSMLRHGRMCSENMPDLILLDLGLPGMNGFEILDEMMEMPSSLRAIPIVILTSHENFEYIREVYPLYILSYLTKPCDTHDMTAILSKVQKNRTRMQSYISA